MLEYIHEKKFVIIFGILIITVLLLISIIVFIPKNNESTPQRKTIFGVWWWNDELDETYLDFACKQGITEIYYCSSKFNSETENFICRANLKGIKVYWLAGEYKWIYDYESLNTKIDKYIEYQNNHTFTFEGIHFDIEPHQHPDFDTNRIEIIIKFVELAYNIKSNHPTLYIEYDLPFWLEDEVKLNGVTKPAYQHVIDNSSRVTIMSYRDSYDKIYSVAKDELEYALSLGKSINFSVETKSEEGDNVSFMEEGKSYMMQEITKLRNIIPLNCGIAIHQIYSWKHLKD